MESAVIKNLLDDTAAVLPKAYAPYSNFPVGCLVLLNNGDRVFGVNIENAAYPVGICAERTAMAQVVLSGRQKDIKAVIVITRTENPGTPCGMCRQFLNEFVDRDTPIICGNTKGDYEILSMAELLPFAFDMSALKNV